VPDEGRGVGIAHDEVADPAVASPPMAGGSRL
jgi:hypothetical protein